ncbi:ATP-binding cassette domain-containing protein [Neorhizobium galegae]|uniref:ATP-binding cassette domain-containing protein n=1 Tax=Neorhizobium galegae TaxID=399 RepID=UPI0006226943|nr:ATP-binding cassette domain-containing protein [Neorhizobium galegae]CDZ34781.1 ABC-type spermidine/putrescine transport system, ATPase component [Neorhizobium galegae bv. officinalis]MCQ1768439.1 ATP-binding cassette domain-containing protein [Neorhizobium galegae]MCQ1776191.1 ATP-binding cassette domain-containing protein [Neorhizobium galegae]MCQ1796627.1 ATP-binding cassette domain-containing protein [Neorhizobium galegae]MCQ1847411.1 ATP-binding cassette domain-containing protein [Neor
MELLVQGNAARVLKIYGWVMLAVIILPVIMIVPISFGAGSAIVFPPKELSLEWYYNLIDDPRWGRDALLSLQVAALATLLATVTGTAAAIGMSRVENKALSKFLKMFFIAPMIVPLMVISVGLYIVFARNGLLGSMWALAIAHAIVVLPFVVMPVTSRLASLDPAYERASASLGATQIRTLFEVILPLLVPAIIAAAIFSFVFSFDEVVLAQFLSSPRFETLPRKVWDGLSQNGLDKTITSIASVQLFLVLVAFAGWNIWKAARTGVLASRAKTLAAAAANALPAVDLTANGSMPMNVALKTAPPVGTPAILPSAEAGPVKAGEQHGYGIDFQHISKFYGDKVVVEEANFSVKPGEFLTILGPSGSGKTTLLMLVAGFISPDAGRLMLGKRDISRVPPHQRDIGVVFQSYALFPHMTVTQNVAYPLRARGVSKSEQQAKVKWALERVHMQDFSERRIAQLSGGQQQRIALARAISFGPRALLMDEPLSALDRNLRVDMQREIRSLQQSLGQTVIFVTHDQEEALNMSDRVAVINEGRVQQVATPRDLYLKPQNSFVANFFGESNLFHGVADGNSLKCGDRAFPMIEARSDTAILCVRPETVRLAAPGQPAPNWAIEGTLANARFLGSLLHMQFATAHGTLVVTRPLDGTIDIPEQGAVRRLFWAPETAHVMTH